MTGSALNLALQLVVLHVELENVKHGVLRDALVEVPEIRILFHWIGLKKLDNEHVNYNIICALYPDILHSFLRDGSSGTSKQKCWFSLA